LYIAAIKMDFGVFTMVPVLVLVNPWC
jgi:hypothetical protein